MNDSTPLLVPIIVSILAPIVVTLLTQWLGKRKAKVEETVTFAGEWKRLYDEMESRLKEAEARLTELEDAKLQKARLDVRVSELELKVKSLSDALEFLMREVEATHPIAVQKAREIARGTYKPYTPRPEK